VGVPDAKPAFKMPVMAMISLILAVFMAILDTSIVNVALPKMMAVFGVNQTQIQWVVTAYALVVGSLIPTTGYLGDRFGYKRVFLYALVIFTLGSALCGLAWSNSSMVFFRIVQAIGGGMLMPISMAMIMRMFPPDNRGMAMGLFGISIMFAPALGPTLSGYIVEYLDWRLIFTLNVPIGILDFFVSFVALKEFKVEQYKRFDFLGFILSCGGLATLLYGVGLAPDKGWSDPEVVTFLLIAGASLTSFVIRQLLIDNPLLDLSLLKDKTFTVSLLVSSNAMIILMGTLFLLPIFLQNISGLSAIDTGLLLLPQAIVSGLMMPIAGALFDKIGSRPLALIGMLITAYALYLTRFLDVTTPHSVLIGWLVLRAVGIGFVMMPVQTVGMNAVPMAKIGQGTALSNVIRQVSAAFGIALIALVFADQNRNHASATSDAMNMFSGSVSHHVAGVQNTFVGMGQSAAQAHSSALSYIGGQIQLQSTVQAMDDVFYLTALLALISFALSFLLPKKQAGYAGAKGHAMAE
jgi:EmrB/QacA subfamily drug resistance transporter